jgi:vacuolar-type H+-ATPase subunit E/Vma4
MENSQDNGKEKLIDDIRLDARKEADRIIEEARKVIEQRTQEAEKKIAAIREETARITASQSAAIAKNSRSSTTVETRRISLKMQEELVREIMGGVEKRLLDLTGTPAYRRILTDWICEAAIGLSVAEAAVTASSRDLPLIDGALLREAEKKVFDLTGKKVSLVKAEDAPCPAQGVVLTARNGKLAFNNCVPTRIMRNQVTIRKIIHNALMIRDSEVRDSEVGHSAGIRDSEKGQNVGKEGKTEQ